MDRRYVARIEMTSGGFVIDAAALALVDNRSRGERTSNSSGGLIRTSLSGRLSRRRSHSYYPAAAVARSRDGAGSSYHAAVAAEKIDYDSGVGLQAVMVIVMIEKPSTFLITSSV